MTAVNRKARCGGLRGPDTPLRNSGLGLQVMEPLKGVEQWGEVIRLRFYVDHFGSRVERYFFDLL